jgi:hypothetical protein
MYEDVYQEAPERVLELLRDVFKDGQFKAFYNGDPDLIPASNLPAICVVLLEDTNSPELSHHDVVRLSLQIRVIFNKKSDWSVKSDKTDLVDKRIRHIIGARDKTTQQYLPNTVKGALRSRASLDGATLDGEMRFELGTLLRPGDTVTREGRLTIGYSYDVQVGDLT